MINALACVFNNIPGYLKQLEESTQKFSI